MRGLYIIGEGPTEEEFINNCLAPYLAEAGILDVRPILMTTSRGHRGGAVSYARLQDNVSRLLKSERDILVSTFIDFFRLHTDFPGYAEATKIADKVTRVTFLEDAISADISQHRFIPYIQLHEFEGLLFSSERAFAGVPGIRPAAMREIQETIARHQNPELLNDGPETAPSKRLQRLIPSYQKPLMGPYMALDIGMPLLLDRCPRFNNWVDLLVARMSS